MIISVDHGNKSIKTPNALFTSGLIVSEGLQGFKTDYICWNNKYYTLTEQRMPDREAVILEEITGEGILSSLHPILFKEDIDV